VVVRTRLGQVGELRAERAVYTVPRRLADLGKAQRELGYRPRVSLADGLAGLVAWWRTTRRHG
jgi:UDP-glucose 4-epimerase